MSDCPDPRFTRALERGVGEFQGGRYYQAHEIWEACWAGEVGVERRFLQGLIMAAAGYCKAEAGVSAGARKLLERALQTLAEFPVDAYGLDLESFRSRIRSDLVALPIRTEIIRSPGRSP